MCKNTGLEIRILQLDDGPLDAHVLVWQLLALRQEAHPLGLPERLGLCERPFRRRFRKNHHELIAPVPADEIHVAAMRPENLPRLEAIGIDGTVLAFTVGATARGSLKQYIAHQEEHHRVKSLREEVVEMLELTFALDSQLLK